MFLLTSLLDFIVSARGIYIGGLPYNITKNSLVEVVRQFGQVKRINDCVQIKKHEVCFVFRLCMNFIISFC